MKDTIRDALTRWYCTKRNKRNFAIFAMGFCLCAGLYDISFGKWLWAAVMFLCVILNFITAYSNKEGK